MSLTHSRQPETAITGNGANLSLKQINIPTLNNPENISQLYYQWHNDKSGQSGQPHVLNGFKVSSNYGDAMSDFTISQLAREANVHIETIRYYERLGMLRQPQRCGNGYRRYDDKDLAQLNFIRKTQTLGFTLKEINQLITLHNDARNNATDVMPIIKNKLSDIQLKLRQLNVIESQLRFYTDNGINIDRGSGCSFFDILWPQESKLNNTQPLSTSNT
jgi:DNA-binding transcriptional MerR regulator